MQMGLRCAEKSWELSEENGYLLSTCIRYLNFFFNSGTRYCFPPLYTEKTEAWKIK